MNCATTCATQVGEQRTRRKGPPRVPLSNLQPASNEHQYMGRLYTAVEYAKLKQKELERFDFNLKYMYRPKFRFMHQGYYNIAHRCRASEIKHLLNSIRVFHADVYPRYFRYEPNKAIRVVVFGNRREFIRHTNTRVYGSYVPAINTMITYCGSGSGTMWHELAHAFIKLNTSQAPPEWFNEGFASFFEKAKIRNGRFVPGYANWRHAYLRKAMDAGQIPSVASLVQSRSLAGRPAALSRARFLFCYLWSRNKMHAFTRIYLFELLPRYQGDELGRRALETLEKLLGKSAAEINSEYLTLARRLRPNQKLPREDAK